MGERLMIPTQNSFSGGNLSAVIYRPVGLGEYPAVVMVHGIGGDKDQSHFRAMGQALSESGKVAIGFDALGWGKSEGDLRRDFRLSKIRESIPDVINFASHRDYVDSRKIGIVGQSAGGIAVIVAACEDPRITAVATISTPTRFDEAPIIKASSKRWRDRNEVLLFDSERRLHTLPLEFLDDASQYGVLAHLKDMDKPLLVVLGTRDRFVLPEDTLQIYDHARGFKRLVEISGMGHDYRGVAEHVDHVNKEVVEFFKEFLD